MAKETVSIRLEPETIKAITAKADMDKRTVSDYLRLFIEKNF